MPVPIITQYVEHRGVKYFRRYFEASGKEYYRSARVKAHGGRSRLLHHVIWEDAHGPIPDGCEIHHCDGDGLNNALANLIAVTRDEHYRRDHERRGGPRGAYSETAAVRSAKRKAEWAARQPRPVRCVECGETFLSEGQRAMFCSRRCRRRFYARERGY